MNFSIEICELKFGTQGWYNRHMKLGKHEELSKGLQHRAGILSHSSLSDRVVLSSMHVILESEFDDENDVEIDFNMNELKRSFTRKDKERINSAFSEHLKTHAKELFDLGVNSKTGNT